ncbi:MAG TPA: hypothetical protein VFQ68_04965 [Streptosporangiaceae bacterium]|nr:hypothetical protein [Streptosporangiaceae bacterium]
MPRQATVIDVRARTARHAGTGTPHACPPITVGDYPIALAFTG